ncbi:hypothetical protein K2173_012182 [Erythroxylum novogranatense]|uniref:TF-B3 domain-containing protein n=1 Tax=Erythroxylum novogranatense TaxID=1862640 RepID=A0AAV8SRX0_9ROSI|nr:hypothetical protein K2173_012182 [Erythroxylum novogranatense]
MEQNQSTNTTTSSSKPHTTYFPHSNSSWSPHLYHRHHQTLLNINTNNNYPQDPYSMFPNQNPPLNFNLKHDLDIDEEQEQEEQQKQQSLWEEVEKEPMFEKPLTPSDVGKLNRLVIPKQHAEKYFPLGGGNSGDKGLLLSFEDEAGKGWRFRYSYWNSSQSYVLTKGWSRYVKEKQLDAGDIVLFERHRRDGDRLFIGWRRRGDSGGRVVVQGSNSGVWSRGLYPSSSSSPGHYQPYPSSSFCVQHGHGANVSSTNSCVPYQTDCLHAGSGAHNRSTTLGNSKRRLRLFGVNLECELEESEPSTPDGSSLSSQGLAQHHLQSQSAYSSDTQSHMVRQPT